MEFTNTSHLLGSAAALLSALSWAVSALLFSQISHSINAISMNLFKGVVAIGCLLLLVLPFNPLDISGYQWLMMSLSGLLGIAIGDTLYFLTLKRLGARLTLLMSTLIPLVAALGAVIVFDEVLTILAIAGLGITFISVCYVLWSKAEQKNTASHLSLGLLTGFVFISTEASAILLSKAAVSELDSLLVTFIRQLIGVAGITIWLLISQQLLQNVKGVLYSRAHLPKLITAAIVGGFIGTWLSIYALKATYASAAVILNATSPLFIILLSIWILKEKIAQSSQIGAIFAVLGIVIYFLQV